MEKIRVKAQKQKRSTDRAQSRDTVAEKGNGEWVSEKEQT